MNIKRFIYLGYSSLKGYNFYSLFNTLKREIIFEIPSNTSRELLINILVHCQKNVPYYTHLMEQIGNDTALLKRPEIYLQNLPILTKDIIRQKFEQLKALDLDRRKWHFNTSGGSTGEPIKLIQDREYHNHSTAISLLYSYLAAGREIGEPEVRLWGSERDIFEGSIGWKAKCSNFLSNTTYLNAFRMNQEQMKNFINLLNTKTSELIVAYVQAIYELAKFAEEQQIDIVPQKAIITSAGTLYDWMRKKIETVFQCKVFNRYGSREVGDIACERPGYEGLWVAPWGNYIEIVDDENNPVPAGVEGNILVTSLTNFAMPLIRYKIGDRGSLSSEYKSGQILKRVSGRNVDVFKTQDGTLIDGEYFTHLMYFKDWIHKFQIIQNSYLDIDISIVKSSLNYEQDDIDDIVSKCKIVMGENCKIAFKFVNEIPPSASGKYRYTISKVN